MENDKLKIKTKSRVFTVLTNLKTTKKTSHSEPERRQNLANKKNKNRTKRKSWVFTVLTNLKTTKKTSHSEPKRRQNPANKKVVNE